MSSELLTSITICCPVIVRGIVVVEDNGAPGVEEDASLVLWLAAGRGRGRGLGRGRAVVVGSAIVWHTDMTA